MFNKLNTKKFTALLGLIMVFAVAAFAQTTTFTYQGRFTDSTLPQPTNGTYEMRFRAFDASSGGNQFPTTITLPTVQVTNGIFTVQLDLGAATFGGTDVFLEIGARPAGSANPLTVLNPRQRVTSAPYAVQSLNANNALNANDSANLGGVAANQYVQTSDARMTDARVPTSGSFNYIQNATSVQPFASFNVSGNGTVGAILSGNIVNSSTQYNINNSRFLSVGGLNNTIAGIGAGPVNSGTGNAFFGTNAGNLNTSGGGNSFYGNSAGATNTNASFNSFFGSAAGFQNSSGDSNSFFGFAAGNKNSSGTGNSFFGSDAGNANTTAGNNSFFGRSAGKLNTGASNSFFGYSAGGSNTTGTQNSFFGESAGTSTATGVGNSFFGYRAGENNTNTANAFFGALAGQSNTGGGSNSFFGYNSGQANLSGDSNSFFGRNAGSGNTGGDSNSFVGFSAGQSNANGGANVFVGTRAGQNLVNGTGNTYIGYQAGQNDTATSPTFGNTLIGYNTKTTPTAIGGQLVPVTHSTAIGADANATLSNAIFLGTENDKVYAYGGFVVGGNKTLEAPTIYTTVSGGGNTSLCLTGLDSGFIASCSSSLRYKTNVVSYAKGYEVIKRLNPITFDWKSDGMHDVGFGAEDVAKVDPLLVTYNKQGIVEGVKYDRISTALVNAVKEQQTQIEQQQQRIAKQQDQLVQMQRQIDVLKNLVPTPRRSIMSKTKLASQSSKQGATK